MRWFAAILTAAALAVFAPSARADNTGTAHPGKTSEINKHVAFVDLYLTQAMTNAKALSAIADAENGKADAKLISEAHKNIDAGIDHAIAHVGQLRTFKSELAGMTGLMPSGGEKQPASGKSGANGAASASGALIKIDELEQHLKDAKHASKRLSNAKLSDLSTAVDGVSTHLMAAHDSFRDLAKTTSYTLLQDQSLGTVPVKGTKTDHDKLDRSGGALPPTTPSTTPEKLNTTPTTPDRGEENKTQQPTSTPPKSTEPTQKAPGGGY